MCTIKWFDRCIYCTMITTIRLINTSITSHNYKLFTLVWTFFFFFWLLLWQVEVLGPDIKPVPQQQHKPLQWKCQIANLLHQKRLLVRSFSSNLLAAICLKKCFFFNCCMVDVQHHLSFGCIKWFTIFKSYIPFIVIVKYWVYYLCWITYPCKLFST